VKWCARCDNGRWVCENHPDKPWLGDSACGCGGAGEPCPVCKWQCRPMNDAEEAEEEKAHIGCYVSPLAPAANEKAATG
jgi:hypothetical protein